MYKQGDLKVTTAICTSYDAEYGECDEDHDHTVYDSKTCKTRKHPCAFLPHSCDSWVIGGADEIKLLIKDLLVIINILE